MALRRGRMVLIDQELPQQHATLWARIQPYESLYDSKPPSYGGFSWDLGGWAGATGRQVPYRTPGRPRMQRFGLSGSAGAAPAPGRHGPLRTEFPCANAIHHITRSWSRGGIATA